MQNLTLSKLRKQDFIVQPVGLNTDISSDYWLQMLFAFDAKKSEVVVTKWWVTDAKGAEVNLSKLSYNEVQFVAQAMSEEYQFHTRLYYEKIESDYYETVRTTSLDEVS